MAEIPMGMNGGFRACAVLSVPGTNFPMGLIYLPKP